ncbi:MAG: DUF3857 domain-containing protein [Myxococcales bacterium]|nr:DUF3857 domain-containing protein [Myxococcales bacterium]
MKRSLVAMGSLAIAVLASVERAKAEPHGALDPLVSGRAAAVSAANGIEAYAALRGLWRAWEHGDPTQIEEALAGFRVDPSLSLPVRAYAGMLAAYARRRRGDLDGAARRFDELGFVRDWLVVGPFENENQTGLATPFDPELELAEPIVLDRAYEGKDHPTGWRRSPDVHRYGWLDLGALIRPNRDVCAYATTFVASDRDTVATLWAGAAGAFEVFFDGAKVVSDPSYRELDADRHAVTVTLEKGAFHRVTVKVCSDESPAAVALRIGDAEGAPLAVRIAATEEASQLAARRQRDASRLGAVKSREKTGRGDDSRRDTSLKTNERRAELSGPLDAFAARLLKTPKDPALLEAYARYLMITGADAEDAHTARDLASRAADTKPTLARLLLAANLAEDRNGRRAWLDRAQAHATDRDGRVELALARAALARSGPNWRDAVPIYRELLKEEPSRPEAVLGLVDLYLEAGLRHSALAELTRALAERPRSVALLRAAIAELRALGRDVDAIAMEARYSALRFDDAGYLRDQLELATARRDEAGAQRWGARLLAADPASSWAHDVVARSERARGRSADAALTYRRALAIAPEDTPTLRAVADLHGELGEAEKQREYLAAIVRIAPQDTAARDYLEHLEPTRGRPDEQYAWPADRLLALRTTSSPGVNDAARRTLRKLTVTTVFPSGLASRFHQLAFQPLTTEAALRSRRFSFTYHADRQAVQLRGARVFRKDGRIDETVTTAEGPANDPSIHMYTLERTYHVQLPPLEPGDVVELKYRVDDVAVRNEMADYFGELEFLQSADPVASAEYVLIAPKSRQLSVAAVGLAGVVQSVKDEGNRRIHHFEAKDLDGVALEPAMPPLAELLGHVHATTMTSWSDVGRWYWNLAKDKLEPDDDVRRLARELTRGVATEAERVAAIYRFAADEIRYVALELGIEGIRPRSAALTLARGWGDCKDKATLIVSMLRELGIEAELVLVRTAMRGGIDTGAGASLQPFDHAIAYVPSLDRYLDGTAESTGSRELPAMDRGSVALRVTAEGGKLVRLPELAARDSIEEREVQLELEREGGLRFAATLSKVGVNAAEWRMRYHDEAARPERIGRDLSELLGPVVLDGDRGAVGVSDPDLVEAPLVVKARGKATATRAGVGWSVPIGSEPTLVARHASLSTRTHPLVLGPLRTMLDSWTVTLPAGARVLAQPKPVRLETPAATYSLELVQGDARRVTVRATLIFKVSRVAPADYPAWREFCRAVDATGTPRIVIAP